MMRHTDGHTMMRGKNKHDERRQGQQQQMGQFQRFAKNDKSQEEEPQLSHDDDDDDDDDDDKEKDDNQL